ncbi:MAG: NAD(P)-dependent glycerol-3-phosphate dehydrogenase [Notoacmeibacter sp.]|nr:NAD(P)-dependent glycerol-3-phosphate dehydrogenase [Notoacmeibacter sp.]
MSSTGKKIAVLGGGAWGTALAVTMIRAGHETHQWVRDSATASAIAEERRNPRYLPAIDLEPGIRASTDEQTVLAGADAVLVVVPAQTLRTVLEALKPAIPANAPLVLCAKGIERGTARLMSDVTHEVLPSNPVAALSGPSFAADVARGLPTAVTVAAQDAALATGLAALLSAPALRCYSSDDLTGVEAGGALKNVLAIAAGTVAGAGLGASAQAATITRGFVELRRIAAALGARPETLMGLSGLGDLILTCGSTQSRNFSYGLALGKGESLENRPLAEGAATAGVAAALARNKGIDAPICDAVSAVLEGRATIAEATAALLSRPLKSEDH